MWVPNRAPEDPEVRAPNFAKSSHYYYYYYYYHYHYHYHYLPLPLQIVLLH